MPEENRYLSRHQYRRLFWLWVVSNLLAFALASFYVVRTADQSQWVLFGALVALLLVATPSVTLVARRLHCGSRGQLSGPAEQARQTIDSLAPSGHEHARRGSVKPQGPRSHANRLKNMEQVDFSPGVWISLGHNRVLGLSLAALGAAMVAIAATGAPIVAYSRPGEVVLALLYAITVGGIGAPIAWFGMGMYRAVVKFTDAEIIIRNPVRSYRIPLSEVQAFETSANGMATRSDTGPGIALKTGGRLTPIGVYAFGENCFRWNVRRRQSLWEPVAKRLNALVEQLRTSHESTT